MAQVSLAQLADPRQFEKVKSTLEHDHPGLRLTLVKVDGEDRLRSQHGGVRVFWLFQGGGEVFLPKGYRTQEGDGAQLPEVYRPDKLDPAFAETLSLLQRQISTVAPPAREPIRAITGRLRNHAFVGDFAGDLWKLEQTPRPWSLSDSV
jgi:hypothetical protein